MKEKRINRISSEVKKVVSETLLNEVKDPGIAEFVSVTDTRVSKDLMYADIYISVLGSQSEKENTMEGLERSKGFLRNAIGRKLKLRLTPELRFHLDESIERGIEMNRLIEETRKADKERYRDE